jgi:hypothetical protein
MKKHKYIYLLSFLILFIAISVMGASAEAFISRTGLRILLAIIFGCVLLSAVFSESEKPFSLNITSGVMLVALALDITYVFVRMDAVRVADLIFGFLFLALIASSILKKILGARLITANLIFAAVCVYLMLGIAWSMIYSLLELAAPGSFNTSAASLEIQDTADTSLQTLYFSFVTLTTLGYGDISPVTPPAQFFAVLEALTGQIYLAVLVAGLVGLHISTAGADKNE